MAPSLRPGRTVDGGRECPDLARAERERRELTVVVAIVVLLERGLGERHGDGVAGRLLREELQTTPSPPSCCECRVLVAAWMNENCVWLSEFKVARPSVQWTQFVRR